MQSSSLLLSIALKLNEMDEIDLSVDETDIEDGGGTRTRTGTDIFLNVQNLTAADIINKLENSENLFKNFEIKLVNLKSKKSFAWQHFGQLCYRGIQLEKLCNKFFCKPCFDNKEIHCVKTSTSSGNQLEHLKDKHQIINQQSQSSINQSSIKKWFSPSSNMTSSKTKTTKSVNTKEKLSRSCVLLLAENPQLPFSFFGSKGFLRFIESLGIDSSLVPSVNCISGSLLEKCYIAAKECLGIKISNLPKNICVILDAWTDGYKHNSYMNYTIMFSTDFQIEVLPLKTSCFQLQKTAINLCEDIEKFLNEFNLKDKNITFVSDRGANILAAIDKFKDKSNNIVVRKSPCILHGLHNLLFNDILRSKNFRDATLDHLMAKIKRILRKFTFRSCDLSELSSKIKAMKFENTLETVLNITEDLEHFNFEELIKMIQKPYHELQNSNDTRWNSVAKMLRTFQENFYEIETLLVLMKSDEILTETDKSLIGELLKIFDIFFEAAEVLQGSTYATLHSVIFYLEKMIKKLEEIDLSLEYGTSIRVHSQIREKLRDRFAITDLHVTAAILNPKLKNKSVINNYLNGSTKNEIIKTQLIKFGIIDAIDFNTEAPREPCKLSERSKMDLLFNEFEDETPTESTNIDNEIEKYLRKCYVDISIEDWWKISSIEFPNIYKLADILWGIPASSAKSESAFSKAGTIISSRRSRINPKKVEYLTFLNSNMSHLEKMGFIPSIKDLWRAQRLKDIDHPHLCEYLDVVRGKHERTIVVSEHTGLSLEDKSKYEIDLQKILRILYQISSGLNELQSMGFVCHNLEPSNILLDNCHNAKLFNFGLFYMTKFGDYVSFPIGNIRYMAPERLLGSKNNIKSDVWSLGLICAELLLECQFWSNLKIANIIRKILSFCSNTKNVFEKIAREHNCYEKYTQLEPEVRDLIEKCLSVSPKDRLLPTDILLANIFQNDMEAYLFKETEKSDNLLLRCPLKQIYYLWQLAGGDVQTELKKEGLIRSEAPILSMPRLCLNNGVIIGPKRSQSYLIDSRIVMLNLNALLERLKNVPTLAYYPLLHSPKYAVQYGTGMEELPLVIRERDTEYQFYRVMLFSRMLKGYPYTRDLICKEAKVDIPPLLRGKIWSCLLDVVEDGSYEKIDKVTPTTTDRQIEVDIPRCHQYDELLSSPEGHAKLKRLLKAWVTSHPQYVYWQGLDSLTAPFLYLNFNNEELAFLSLYKFIPKYLQWFFLKDNSAIIKEYLSKFSQLTAFHEPILAEHLNSIHFIPELFAIPWFLTMFSHVFPLHKIIHLWDKLMLGDHSYPLFIGISILKQLKTTLLASGFNECILLFSDLPDIVMETCVIESQKMYEITPKSVTWRKHISHEFELNEFDITNITLKELQNEISPRISSNDFVDLLLNTPEKLLAIDLRGTLEYNRLKVLNSINIPFNSVLLGDTRLESLNVQNLDTMVVNKIVVVISSVHENAVLFAKFLVECHLPYVCILHDNFEILTRVVPNILIENN